MVSIEFGKTYKDRTGTSWTIDDFDMYSEYPFGSDTGGEALWWNSLGKAEPNNVFDRRDERPRDLVEEVT